MRSALSALQKLRCDEDLIAEVARLAGRERRATVDLIRSLMELDARRLYLGEGYPSLFAYCTQVLHYAEHAALNRIEIARAARRFTRLLDLIAEGGLHLSGARLLVPHLTDENCDPVLMAATHKSKRQIEEIVAELHPLPAVVPMVRKLPCASAVPETPRVLSLASEQGGPAAPAERGSVPGTLGSVAPVAPPSAGSSNSTTPSRSPRAARGRARMSSCDAGRTMRTRPRCSLAQLRTSASGSRTQRHEWLSNPTRRISEESASPTRYRQPANRKAHRGGLEDAGTRLGCRIRFDGSLKISRRLPSYFPVKKWALK